MPKKCYTSEQIINFLREAKVLLSKEAVPQQELQDTWIFPY